MHLLVLSAFRRDEEIEEVMSASCLNAPSGAQCFPTSYSFSWMQVSTSLNAPSGAQCFPTRQGRSVHHFETRVSMHLLVLSALRLEADLPVEVVMQSQCTFWCSVLSDQDGFVTPNPGHFDVSMHLLVLSALRRSMRRRPGWSRLCSCLNAPSGAQCSPTVGQLPTPVGKNLWVSMHLLVLSALRRVFTWRM